MADFVGDHEKATEGEGSSSVEKIDFVNPVIVKYCGICSMPPEFCEFGTCYDRCLPWIRENCPEVLGENAVTEAVGKVSLEDGATAAPEEPTEVSQPALINSIIINITR